LAREKVIFNRKTEEYRLHVDDTNSGMSLAILISELTTSLLTDGDDLVVLCIGTDRCTGDALGPLIGSRLLESGLTHVHVYGTLENPVHATNLQKTLEELQSRHKQSVVIAIDACLGKLDNVGNIMVGKGPLKPGAGVSKDLPAVGDLFITGIVNVGGFMDYLVLQNTRLYLITRLADVIAEGLAHGLANLTLLRKASPV
jgi:putative sporulation protein YyaC